MTTETAIKQVKPQSSRREVSSTSAAFLFWRTGTNHGALIIASWPH
ncbi:MAG: hypothetical protein U0Y68_06170 [Blastocatellia bacterium]